jgi:RNA polymerase sigma-70 factor, ECF subfamily
VSSANALAGAVQPRDDDRSDDGSAKPESMSNLLGSAQERVFRLALRITRSPEDAEDVQQETFLKVHRKMDQFEGRSRFTTWISRIAINEALMCLRKRRSSIHVPLEDETQPNKEHVPIDEFHSPIEGPEEAYSRKELRESLTHAISLLRPAYRTVFLLRVVEQLSTTETAKILRISPSAVKARMRRARGELQEALAAARRNGNAHAGEEYVLACCQREPRDEYWLS